MNANNTTNPMPENKLVFLKLSSGAVCLTPQPSTESGG
jgi:hypothetical protein